MKTRPKSKTIWRQLTLGLGATIVLLLSLSLNPGIRAAGSSYATRDVESRGVVSRLSQFVNDLRLLYNLHALAEEQQTSRPAPASP